MSLTAEILSEIDLTLTTMMEGEEFVVVALAVASLLTVTSDVVTYKVSILKSRTKVNTTNFDMSKTVNEQILR